MIVNANSIVQHEIQNKNENNKTCQCECKSYRKRRENYSWNPGACICENNNYLKSIADTAVTGSEKFIIIINNLTAKRQIL